MLDRRRQLLDSARELFLQQSYEHVTTTTIAKSAGVAYGLIAHHFGNKRGLYLAVMNEIADELRAHRDKPIEHGTPLEQLRASLTRHIEFVDAHAEGFVAVMTGGLGADPELRAMVDSLRWSGAQRILDAVGLTDPIPPALRTSMKGWVGCLDEMMIDRIAHGDIDIGDVVSLASANLITSLRTALHIDRSGIDPSVVDFIDTLPTD